MAPGDEISAAWLDLQSAWLAEDAPGVNTALVTLANSLQLRNPEIYPSGERLQWESFYFQWSHLTWVWIIYLFSIALLLMWIVYKWRGAFWLGMTVFGLGFVGQTIAVVCRGSFPQHEHVRGGDDIRLVRGHIRAHHGAGRPSDPHVGHLRARQRHLLDGGHDGDSSVSARAQRRYLEQDARAS